MLNRRSSAFLAALSLFMLIGSVANAALLFGTNGPDSLDGGTGDDYLFGRRGNDTLLGGVDDDRIFLSAGRDNAQGGDGTDVIIDDDGRSRRKEKGDILSGGQDVDEIYSADGEKDFIDCGNGATDVVFADGNDVVTNCETAFVFTGQTYGIRTFGAGTNRSDTIFAGSAAIAFGKGGNDTITGSNGDDILLGGKGRDSSDGGIGNDTLYDDDGTRNDQLKGGVDIDLIFSADGARDFVDCGGLDGVQDSVYVDDDDVVTGCLGDLVFLT